jgi:hypothetical protein
MDITDVTASFATPGVGKLYLDEQTVLSDINLALQIVLYLMPKSKKTAKEPCDSFL